MDPNVLLKLRKNNLALLMCCFRIRSLIFITFTSNVAGNCRWALVCWGIWHISACAEWENESPQVPAWLFKSLNQSMRIDDWTSHWSLYGKDVHLWMGSYEFWCTAIFTSTICKGALKVGYYNALFAIWTFLHDTWNL